jgi:phospholipase C
VDGSFRIDFANTGQAAAVLWSARAVAHVPRTYTVEPGKSLSDTWALDSLIGDRVFRSTDRTGFPRF